MLVITLIEWANVATGGGGKRRGSEVRLADRRGGSAKPQACGETGRRKREIMGEARNSSGRGGLAALDIGALGHYLRAIAGEKHCSS